MSEAAHGGEHYYLPHGSHWPIMGSIGLICLTGGFASMLNGSSGGGIFMIIGLVVIVAMMFGWFGTVIRESLAGYYNDQVDLSFRWGMGWFIFSEVLFFGAFFGALFYARQLAIPWLAGSGAEELTGQMLWSGFESEWPSNGPGNVGGVQPHGEFEAMPAWGVPALNTLILLSSGATITWAHWGLKREDRRQLVVGLMLTVALGVTFLFLQAGEYYEAAMHMGLTLGTGIYGSTFFMLTGFHGAHVTIGAIMLTAILYRSIRGHFSEHNHFAFEAAAWYWHFVDVVWLGLFIFVYWL